MTRPRLFLCECDKARICELEPISMSGSFKFNAYSELTFTIGRTYTDMITGETQVNPFYNKIEALRLLELEGFGFFEIQDPEIVSDGIREVKNVTAYSLEYTLSQKYIEELYVNTGEVNSVEVIYSEKHKTPLKPVSLYNFDNPNLSLLNLALEKIYGWSIGHIDTSLQTMARTFEISRTSVYDFIVQDICEKFNCFVVFDTIKNTINLYSEALITKHLGDAKTKKFKVPASYSTIDSVAVDGYKTTKYQHDIQTNYVIFNDDAVPPKGAKIEITDGSQSDWVTDVYVTFQNLAQEVNVSYSADDIKTVLTVKGADDLDIREVNMGLPYLVDISYYYNVDWMGEELFNRYTEYVEKTNEYQDEYAENAQSILKLQNDISFLENRVSLGYGIDSSVNSKTVGTYYIIKGGSYPNYTYEEVSLPDDYDAEKTYYKLNGVNVTEEKVHTLYSAVRKYFIDIHGKKEPEIKDIATRDKTWEELLEDLTEQFDFIKNEFAQLKSVLKSKPNVNTSANAYRTFLDIIWGELGRTPLKDLFLKPYKEIESANNDAGYSDENSDNYWFYYPVTIMIDSLNDAIKDRDEDIAPLESDEKIKKERNDYITDEMSIYNHFTPKQLVRLSSFLREDEYTDDNFVETDIDTIETLMKTKNELRECGLIELHKLCEPKLAFSMNMANIYALPEFEPIIDQFQLGKLINVAIRSDYVKRARLLAVDINFDDFSDFTCEFGELTNLRTPSSIHADLLANALSAGKAVASNMSYWNKGADVATSTDLKIQEGLLYGTNGLFKSDQGVVIDSQGIKLTKIINKSTGEVSPHQTWLTNNTILFSSDGFKTSRAGYGEFTVDGQTFYGPLAEAMFAGYIEGSRIVGGTINIGDGTFVVDSAGNVQMKAASIAGYATSDELSDAESGLSSRILLTENELATKVSNGSIISTINQSAEGIAINADKISLAGKTIDLTSDNITIQSTNFNVTKDGKITATSGEIAGWTIYDDLLRKETVVNDVTYQMYMQASDGVNTTNAFAVRKRNPDVSSWDVQFAVTYAGKMTAKNANITGTITAKDGSIAGYNIGPGGSYDNAIYKRVAGDGSGVDYEVGLKATSGDTDLAFYVKQSEDQWANNSNVFYVRNNGQLYAQKADITGKITASSGKIGSWNVGDMGNYTDSMYSTFCAASTPSSDNPEYAVFMRGKGSSSSTIAIGVKKRTSSSTSWNDADNPFYVRKDGYVVMTNANVTGTVNATAGNIGGCSISNGVLNVSAANITSGTIATARIPNLNADKITAGTINADRIPNISASKITSGTISTSRLDSSVITTGNFSSKTLSTSSLTVASGCRLGVASEYNALLYTSGSYTNVRAYGPDINYGISWYALIKQAVQQSSSSAEIKQQIHDFDDRYDIFFDNLNPKLYKYNFATAGGFSMGYIWEESKDAYEKAGLTANDVGAINETESVDGGKELVKSDFIALNTWQIQKLKKRVEELENRLEALERNDTK